MARRIFLATLLATAKRAALGDHEIAQLAGVGEHDLGSLRRRLGKARQEIEIATASGVYKHVVVNDRLEQSVPKVVRIVQGESQE